MSAFNVSFDLPLKLEGFLQPHRYKIAYGGRGGAKSWSVAQLLLVMGMERKLRILCARELQKSIDQSVHQLLSDSINRLGLQDFYTVQRSKIIGINGTEFGFCGLKHNPTELKSYEGADICWVEEAQAVSSASWKILIPTIRKEGSEIWLTFNPDLEEDITYQRFVVNPPSNSYVVKINWSDNIHRPRTLDEERLDLMKRDYDEYLHVWEGHCRQTLEGAVYANEIRLATSEDRITKVPHDPMFPVHCFFDLGWADHTTIWFAQFVGMEFRLINYYQDNQKPISDYLQHMQSLKYTYGQVWLPHDAKAKQLGTGKSIQEIVEAAGFRVEITPKLSVVDGINASRMIFQNCYFDRDNCADGIQCLRHYRYDVDPDTKQFSNKPVHDIYSHGADGFRYFAIAASQKRGIRQNKTPPRMALGGSRKSTGWMA